MTYAAFLQEGSAGQSRLLSSEPGSRYGEPRLIQPRLGQATFRIAVLDAYGRACAVTGEHSLPALEAAHIRSYAESGPHEICNGLLLRADLHRLFDTGYVTVTPELRLGLANACAGITETVEVTTRFTASIYRFPASPPIDPRRIVLERHDASQASVADL